MPGYGGAEGSGLAVVPANGSKDSSGAPGKGVGGGGSGKLPPGLLPKLLLLLFYLLLKLLLHLRFDNCASLSLSFS